MVSIAHSLLNANFVDCQDNPIKEFDENKALDFLVSLLTNYSGDKWLCKEHNKSTTYWVYNDNALAFQILKYIGNKTGNSTLDAAEKIKNTIENNYRISIMEGNDRIEVMFKNQTISFPPHSGTGYHFSPIEDHDMQLSENLVMNSGVESGSVYPDYWYFSDPSRNRTQWSTEQSRNGSHSLNLVGNFSKDFWHWRSHVFPVSPSKNYLFRCYVNGTVQSGEWYLTIRWFNASDPIHENFIFENNTQIGIEDHVNWTQIIGFNFTSPSKASFADILFRCNGTGTLYAEDFEVREIISAGSYIVRNDVKHVRIPDWQDYADLLLFGVLDRYNRNDSSWKDLWNNATKMFNGTGMVDKAFNTTGKFDTYKLALFIITATTINQTQDIIFPQNHTKIEIFGKLQKPNGGVVTHYLQNFSPDPNATENIETTCLAIYACLPEEEIPIAWIPEFPTLLLVFMLLLIVTIRMVAKKLSITSHDPVRVLHTTNLTLKAS
jgi:hypothetical protein